MRYYENIYPKVGELVMVEVSSITDAGVYVKLLEYDSIEGMISIREMTNRRFTQKLTRVGRIEVVVVLYVDEVKGYIDLSKKKVTTEEIVLCETKWHKSKWVNRLLTHLENLCKEDSELADWDLLCLSQQIAWPLHPNAYELLTEGHIPPAIQGKLRQLLNEEILKQLNTQSVKLRADIDVICYLQDSIDCIKEALLCGLSVDKESSVRITLNNSPSYTYIITLTAFNKEKGLELLRQICDVIVKKIAKRGGDAIVNREPCEVETGKVLT